MVSLLSMPLVMLRQVERGGGGEDVERGDSPPSICVRRAFGCGTSIVNAFGICRGKIQN